MSYMRMNDCISRVLMFYFAELNMTMEDEQKMSNY